jgi:rod shape-determining protein MreD
MPSGKFYDLVALFVLHLGLVRSIRESLPAVMLAGCVMDYLSGGPAGIYLTAYIWLFMGVKWIIRYLHAGSIFLLPFVAGLSVLIENLVFLSSISYLTASSQFPPQTIKTAAHQFLWVLLTGPFLLLLFERVHFRLDKWRRENLRERNGIIR